MVCTLIANVAKTQASRTQSSLIRMLWMDLLRTFRCSVLITSLALRGIQSEFTQAANLFKIPADFILT